MGTFYDLPLEIRQMIYHECLVVGEIYPYSLSDAHQPDTETARDKTGCDLPTVALVQVSKTVRCEAEPMLYQRNVFRLGSATATEKFFERYLNTSERRMWLKSVRMSLNFEDIAQTHREVVLAKQVDLAQDLLLFPEKDRPHTVRNLKSFERQLHNEYRKFLAETVWPRKTSPILEHCKLEKLLVDFKGTTCQARCCNMRCFAILAFRKGFVMGMPKQLQITGFKDEKAKATKQLIRKWTSWRVANCDLQNVLDIFPEESGYWM